MRYFMEDQVEQHFRYVISICACYNVLQRYKIIIAIKMSAESASSTY